MAIDFRTLKSLSEKPPQAWTAQDLALFGINVPEPTINPRTGAPFLAERMAVQSPATNLKTNLSFLVRGIEFANDQTATPGELKSFGADRINSFSQKIGETIQKFGGDPSAFLASQPIQSSLQNVALRTGDQSFTPVQGVGPVDRTPAPRTSDIPMGTLTPQGLSPAPAPLPADEAPALTREYLLSKSTVPRAAAEAAARNVLQKYRVGDILDPETGKPMDPVQYLADHAQRYGTADVERQLNAIYLSQGVDLNRYTGSAPQQTVVQDYAGFPSTSIPVQTFAPSQPGVTPPVTTPAPAPTPTPPVSNGQFIQGQLPTQQTVFGMPTQDVQSFILSRMPGQQAQQPQQPLLTPTAARHQLDQIYQQFTQRPVEPVLPGMQPSVALPAPVEPTPTQPQQFFREGGPVKKFADGGSAGSSSGVRRLEMSGYQEGGEVTDDDFIQEMMVGTRPTDQEALVERTSDVFYKTPKSQQLASQIRDLFQQMEAPSPSAEEDYLKRRPTPESREPIRSRKAMEAFLKAANPRMEIEERPLPGGRLGFVREADPDTLVISTRQFPAQREETAFHELEHSLSERGGNPLGKLNKEGKPLVMDNNYRFDVLYNQDNKTGGKGRSVRFDMMKRLIDNKDNIEKFFGRPIDSEYFSGKPGSGLFAEQIADLSALEQVTNKSLARDPKMRKLLFPDDKAAAVYDSITGLRQTRLDAKDLPPYTPIFPEEKGMMDLIKEKLGMGKK